MDRTSVLLIEDSAPDRHHIELLLRHQPMDVSPVETLSDGLQQIRESIPDVVLLDLSLPDSDGLSSVVEIASHWPNLPIVVLTGLDDSKVATESLGKGAQDYLSKNQIDTELLVRSLFYAIERKRIMTRWQATESKLRRTESLASLGTLAAGIAHEINNPIVAAWTSAEAALNVIDERDSREMTRDCLQNVVRSVKRVREIIDNMVLLARHGELKRQPCDLDEIAHSAVAEIAPLAVRSGIHIAVHKASGSTMIDGNSVQLQQVLVTLIRNAIEASTDGQTVQVSIDSEERLVRVSVEDAGHGMTPEESQRAFDPFFSSEKKNGMGLGLSIAHAIVQWHGGSIDLESTLDVGSTFSISLPNE